MKPARAVFFVLCSLLVSASAMATTDVPVVYGYVLYDNSTNVTVANAEVRLCTTPYVDSYCRSTISSYNGQYYFTSWGVPDDATLYLFAWIDAPYAAGGRTGRWGSNTVYQWMSAACQYRDQFGGCHNYGWQAQLVLQPAPLQPTAIYPAPNATNVPTPSPTFKWTSSQDSWRQYVTIVYEIWGSGYGAPMILQAGNLPCNPDAAGRCQWVLPANLLPNTPYNWKIVAKALHYYRTLETSSSDYHFTTGN